MPYSILLNADHALFLTCLGVHSVVGTSTFWLAWRYLRHRPAALAREARILSRALAADDDLPDILVQLPAFNERELILRAAEAVQKLDWPHRFLHVQILDDSTDPESQEA